MNDCGSAASSACGSHKGNASDHEDRIAHSGMFSRFCRPNANGDVEVRLGCRSTVFVYGLYADECTDHDVLVGLRLKTSLVPPKPMLPRQQPEQSPPLWHSGVATRVRGYRYMSW